MAVVNLLGHSGEHEITIFHILILKGCSEIFLSFLYQKDFSRWRNIKQSYLSAGK